MLGQRPAFTKIDASEKPRIPGVFRFPAKYATMLRARMPRTVYSANPAVREPERNRAATRSRRIATGHIASCPKYSSVGVPTGAGSGLRGKRSYKTRLGGKRVVTYRIRGNDVKARFAGEERN